MHAAAAVLLSLFVVSAQPATTRPARSARTSQPVVVAASVPTVVPSAPSAVPTSAVTKVLPASHSRNQEDNLSAPAQPAASRSATVTAAPPTASPAVQPASKFVSRRPVPRAEMLVAEPKLNPIRAAHSPSNSQPRVAAAPRRLPQVTPAAATTRKVSQPEELEPAPAPPQSFSSPAASAGALTGPGPFDYMYTGQEAPPWLRPYDEDPNLRNFWYHTEPRLNRHGKVPHCRSTCNLLGHIEYFPEAHGNYYFRPYTFTRLLQQQDQAARMGINPALPYSNELYDKIYAEFDARRRTETVEPGEMPGEMQEFETDTESNVPTDEG